MQTYSQELKHRPPGGARPWKVEPGVDGTSCCVSHWFIFSLSEVQLPDGPQKFLVEEHINALVDRLERRLRSKVVRGQ